MPHAVRNSISQSAYLYTRNILIQAGAYSHILYVGNIENIIYRLLSEAFSEDGETEVKITGLEYQKMCEKW